MKHICIPFPQALNVDFVNIIIPVTVMMVRAELISHRGQQQRLICVPPAVYQP